MRDLPEMLYVSHPVDGRTIIIKAYESGYYECGPGYRDRDPKELNREYGLPTDEKVASVMINGSMFGWDIPMVREWRLQGASFNRKASIKRVAAESNTVKRTTRRR